MSRSMWDFQAGKPLADVNFIINDYLTKEGFRIVDYKGEKVWKKGSGWLTAPQYMGFKFLNGSTIHIEAWIRFALLPGVYLGDLALKGFFGFALKKYLLGRVNHLINWIK